MSLIPYTNFQQLTTAISYLPFLGIPCNTSIQRIETEIVLFSLFQNQIKNISSSPMRPLKSDFSAEAEKETTKGYVKRHANIVCPVINLMAHLVTYVAHSAFAPFSWIAQHSSSADHAGCLPYYRHMLTSPIQRKESLCFLEKLNAAFPPFHEIAEPYFCSEPFPNWFLEENPLISLFPLTARENEQFMRTAIEARGEEALVSVGLNYQGNIADLVKYAIEKSDGKWNPSHELISSLPSEFRENRKWMKQLVDGFGALAFQYARGDLRKDANFLQYVRKKAIKESEDLSLSENIRKS